MWWFFFIGTIVIPVIMLWLDFRVGGLRTWFAAAAVISFIFFSVQNANAIYKVIRDNEVFMTTIHGIFLDPIVLTTGSYLGLYTIYLLLKYTVSHFYSRK